MRTDDTGNSARLAIHYKDNPLTLEELEIIEGKVTKECWKYLIGKLCSSEKEKRRDNERVIDILEQLGETFGYAGGSIKNLAVFANSVDRINKYQPDIAADILNGKTRLAEKDIFVLSRMDFVEINAVMKRLDNETISAKLIIAEQKALRTKTKRPGRPKLIKNETPRASVKDNPTYDPDAQINALTYTIPSWVNMIERAFSALDFKKITPHARERLAGELTKLTDVAKAVTALITEGENEYC